MSQFDTNLKSGTVWLLWTPKIRAGPYGKDEDRPSTAEGRNRGASAKGQNSKNVYFSDQGFHVLPWIPKLSNELVWAC